MKEGKKVKDAPKQIAKWVYDWGSKTWSGAQRFDRSVTETVVLQKIPEQIHDMLLNNPVLKKFWSFLLTHAGHFDDSDKNVVAFALISMKGKNWVINEIQTDNIQQPRHFVKHNAEQKASDRTPDASPEFPPPNHYFPTRQYKIIPTMINTPFPIHAANCGDKSPFSPATLPNCCRAK